MHPTIKFRHLDAFCAIARAGSLKRAAAQLNLTQPAISRTLKELELSVGATLMERDRSGVRLTPEGETFLQFAEQSTAALKRGLRSVQAPGVSTGRLRLGALPSVASTLLPLAVDQFLGASPDVTLEIHEGPHDDLTGRLRSGKLDLVVGRLGRPASMEGLTFQQLYAEEVVVVARSDSPARHVTDFDDLNAFRVLYPPQNSAIRPLVARLLISQSIPLFPNRIESASSSFGRAMVLGDPDMVWFISRGVVANDLENGSLVALPLDTAPTTGAVGIMSRADDIKSASSRLFIRSLIDAAKTQIEGGRSQRENPKSS